MSGRRKTNWFATFMLTVGVLFILFPMYMALVVALKSPQQLAQSLLAFPARMHWGNFAQAMSATHYWHVFGNSFFITSCAVIFTIFTNSVVAYAIARNLHRAFFKGIYYYIISAMFVPFPVSLWFNSLFKDNTAPITICRLPPTSWHCCPWSSCTLCSRSALSMASPKAPSDNAEVA